MAFANTFKKIFNINVMFNEKNVPKVDKKDVRNWVVKSVNRASNIIYFLSPLARERIVNSGNEGFFDLVSYHISNKIPNNILTKILVVKLPYPSQNIPKKLKNCKSYVFTHDTYKFFNLFRRNGLIIKEKQLRNKHIDSLIQFIQDANYKICKDTSKFDIDNKSNVLNDTKYLKCSFNDKTANFASINDISTILSEYKNNKYQREDSNDSLNVIKF